MVVSLPVRSIKINEITSQANTWTAEQTFNDGINIYHNSYLNGDSLTGANLGFFGYGNSGYVLGQNISFISLWNNNDDVGAFIGENDDSVLIGMFNRTSTTQGALSGNKWSPFLEITFDGEVYTSSNVNADIGTTASINGRARNILDDASGNMSIAGGLTVSGEAKFNDGISINSDYDTGDHLGSSTVTERQGVISLDAGNTITFNTGYNTMAIAMTAGTIDAISGQYWYHLYSPVFMGLFKSGGYVLLSENATYFWTSI